jgi:flagellar assembly factor FliW
VLESYPLEISDEDAEDLGLQEGNDALVLSIVAIHSLEPQFVTVNLVGPIVVNRKTWVGKQVIVANLEAYSVAHVLVDMREPVETQPLAE